MLLKKSSNFESVINWNSFFLVRFEIRIMMNCLAHLYQIRIGDFNHLIRVYPIRIREMNVPDQTMIMRSIASDVSGCGQAG